MTLLYLLIFYLPFLFLSILIVGIFILAQKRFRVKPRVGIPIACCVTVSVFAFFGISGAHLFLGPHFSLADISEWAELIYVYIPAIVGMIYGFLMGFPLYQIANDFAHRTSRIRKSDLVWEITGVIFIISFGLFCISLYYGIWQMA
jgi:hypothetical protein